MSLASPNPAPRPDASPRDAPPREDAARWTRILILATLALRLAFAGMLGLGIDESYMVAAGRALHTGYYDHPPAAWWLAWAAANTFNSEAHLAVRLPFIALFALSTWLMFCLARRLYSPRAGLYAAIAFNISPIFGITGGSWVLPDGPLDAALLAAALFFVRALPIGANQTHPQTPWRDWLAVGICAGLALFSKYTAALPIAGAALFVLTHPTHRAWLRRPHPYAAALAAFAFLLPVLAWNAANGWASLAFQAERSIGMRFRPLMPLNVLAGEALFLLPWIWLALTIAFIVGLSRARRDERLWLQTCLGGGLILAFPLISIWSSQRMLFHWAAPGYLMLFPALGAWLAQGVDQGRRWIKPLIAASAAIVTTIAMLIAGGTYATWFPPRLEQFVSRHALVFEAVDWTSLRQDLESRGLLNQNLILVGLRWQECGKLDYAVGRLIPLLCLTPDPRQYGLNAPAKPPPGRTFLVITTKPRDIAALEALGVFSKIEPLPPTTVLYGQQPVLPLFLFLAQTAPD